ncbi:MAG TPA: hypothetical protein VFH56_02995 [Acidimicrobiales bacterium]|nr:hypothetical protein [Acidimicrobiales bacterium]
MPKIEVGRLRGWARELRDAAGQLVPPGQLAEWDRLASDITGQNDSAEFRQEMYRPGHRFNPAMEAYLAMRHVADELEAIAGGGVYDR